MRDRREPPDEIEAHPWKDYVPTPDKGAREPFMAPGGWLALAGIIFTFALYFVAHRLIQPIAAWMDGLIGW